MCLLVPTSPYIPTNPSQYISLSKNIRKTNKSSPHAILFTNLGGLSATYFLFKGGSQVLAATAKIGSKYLVNIDILKALGAEIEQLPEKEKVMFDFKSAVAFLRPFLELAIKKNYTKDEIFQLMGKVGWSITQNTFKYFWSLFLLEEESSAKKKSVSKSAGKIKRETSQANTRANKIEVWVNQHQVPSAKNETITEDETLNSEAQKLNPQTNETQPTASQVSTQEKSDDCSTQKNGALFDIPPDSEDL